jgi:hypothetical protein
VLKKEFDIDKVDVKRTTGWKYDKTRYVLNKDDLNLVIEKFKWKRGINRETATVIAHEKTGVKKDSIDSR